MGLLSDKIYYFQPSFFVPSSASFVNMVIGVTLSKNRIIFMSVSTCTRRLMRLLLHTQKPWRIPALTIGLLHQAPACAFASILATNSTLPPCPATNTGTISDQVDD